MSMLFASCEESEFILFWMFVIFFMKKVLKSSAEVKCSKIHIQLLLVFSTLFYLFGTEKFLLLEQLSISLTIENILLDQALYKCFIIIYDGTAHLIFHNATLQMLGGRSVFCQQILKFSQYPGTLGLNVMILMHKGAQRLIILQASTSPSTVSFLVGNQTYIFTVSCTVK